MRALHRSLAIGVLAALLAGCSLLPGAQQAALTGEWRLQAGTHQGAPLPLVAANPITLKFDGTKVGGHAACNIYGGTLEVSGTTIKISALSMTEMACAEPVMASEAAYLAALPLVTGAARDGASLVLSGPQVELRFALVVPVADADLVGPAWALESLITGQVVSSVVADKPASLQLKANGKLTASTGCRDVTGTYAISSGTVTVTLDPYDLIGCPDPVGSQDAHVLAVIGAADGFTFAIDGNSLTVMAGERGLGYRTGEAAN